MAAADRRLDQAMAIEHGMDRAFGGDSHLAGQAAHQQLPDLARPPVRLVLLGPDDRGLQLVRQLIGVAYRPPRSIGEAREAMVLVAIEDFVAGFARDAELTTRKAHRLAFQQTGHKPKALVHHRTLFPRHRHFPPAIAGGKCYPCVRYELAPMSRAAHTENKGFGRAHICAAVTSSPAWRLPASA